MRICDDRCLLFRIRRAGRRTARSASARRQARRGLRAVVGDETCFRINAIAEREGWRPDLVSEIRAVQAGVGALRELAVMLVAAVDPAGVCPNCGGVAGDGGETTGLGR